MHQIRPALKILIISEYYSGVPAPMKPGHDMFAEIESKQRAYGLPVNAQEDF
jgi:hypothetical protein